MPLPLEYLQLAPPVPQCYTLQYRCGQKTYTQKSPLTLNDVLDAKPIEVINASATGSTTILKPERPDTASFEYSTLIDVTEQRHVRLPVELVFREPSSDTSLISTIPKALVRKHTDPFSKTEAGDDRSNLPIQNKPTIFVYHKGKRPRIKLSQ